jgi:serine phosphatase RsbU (regulator of sigma subunit)
MKETEATDQYLEFLSKAIDRVQKSDSKSLIDIMGKYVLVDKYEYKSLIEKADRYDHECMTIKSKIEDDYHEHIQCLKDSIHEQTRNFNQLSKDYYNLEDKYRKLEKEFAVYKNRGFFKRLFGYRK